MYGPRSIYSFDIETDNSEGFGLDPHQSRITEIAVAVDASLGGGEVFDGPDEAAILIGMRDYFASLPNGLIAPWNSAFFDLPFIDTRAQILGVDTGWVLTPDPELVPKYEPTPGHAGGYSAYWADPNGVGLHAHLDVAQAYKARAADMGVKWSLKPVAIADGIDMIELDRTNLHLYTAQERKDYCLSDANGARQLGVRLLGW